MIYSYHATAEGDTERLAEAIAAYIEPGNLIALDGDLGAGKTRFAQAVARYIGVKGIVNSPTFTIIKEYQGKSFPMYHMDVYRINLEEAEELGLDEYFYGHGVTLVEWASRIEEILPVERLAIYIENCGGEERRFSLDPKGRKYEAWCNILKGNGTLS